MLMHHVLKKVNHVMFVFKSSRLKQLLAIDINQVIQQIKRSKVCQS